MCFKADFFFKEYVKRQEIHFGFKMNKYPIFKELFEHFENAQSCLTHKIQESKQELPAKIDTTEKNFLLNIYEPTNVIKKADNKITHIVPWLQTPLVSIINKQRKQKNSF